MAGKFPDVEAIRLKFQGFAGDCVSALEAGLEQKDLDAIGALLFPAATPEQTREAYDAAKTLLTAKGITETDPVMSILLAEQAKEAAGEVKP